MSNTSVEAADKSRLCFQRGGWKRTGVDEQQTQEKVGMIICSLVRCLRMFSSFEKKRTISYETNGKLVDRG